MNFEKWTERAQNAVMESQNLAISLGHQQMDGEHLHLALLTQNEGLISKLLKNMNNGCSHNHRQLAKRNKISRRISSDTTKFFRCLPHIIEKRAKCTGNDQKSVNK